MSHETYPIDKASETKLDGKGQLSELSFPDLTRRTALKGGAALAVAHLLRKTDPAWSQEITNIAPGSAISGEYFVPLQARVNGRDLSLQVDARTSLLDFLRESLELTGAKKGCDHGQCGACTVHVNGRRVASCLMLAAKAERQEITTIEGLSDGKTLHPMQQAFIDHDALQCGYCTPGQIMAAVACVAEGNAASKERIREYMSGNLCRCGAYVGIVAAVQDAAWKMGKA